MVSKGTIMAISISTALVFIVPIVLLFYFRKKYQISFKVFFIGMFTFFLFASVLEGVVHAYFLTFNETTKTILANPWVFMAYGGLMAGLFEESGRYLMMRFVLKNQRAWKDGLAFGLGHGGIEAMLIVGISNISMLVYASMINKGVFDSLLKNELMRESLLPIRDQLLETPSYLFALGGVERMCALAIQIALSILVLYAVRTGKIGYFFMAILLHATINIPAGLYQAGIVSNIILIEVILAILAIIAITWIVKAKPLFEQLSTTLD